MKHSKKKTGYSLIFIVILFMFISIVSIGVLSMIVGNYKARAVESKRIENLYGSESGLDIAYNVVAKTIDNANKYSYNKVEKFKKEAEKISYSELDNYKNSTDDVEKYMAYYYILKADIVYRENITNEKNKIKEDNNKIDLLINTVFRYYFEKYINGRLIENIVGNDLESNNGQYIANINTINDDYSTNENNIYKISYNNALVSINSESINSDKNRKDEMLMWHKNKGNEEAHSLVEEYHFEYNEKKKENEIKTNKTDIKYEYSSNTTTLVDLISKFKLNSSVGENERQIESKYTLIVPNYNEVTFQNSIESSAKELPGITVGGNLNIKGLSLTVNGDIMVEGSDSKSTYNEKYIGGISIDNTDSITNVDFNNSVYCRKTFNVKDNSIVSVNRDLYANNIYINSSKEHNKNSILNINNNNYENNVVINNDLEMNATNARVNIKNFYALSGRVNEQENLSKDDKAVTSGSIIINNNDKENRNSTVLIQGKAYINGVAHIKTQNGYQTGESVSVKGNYVAYSVPINSNDSFLQEKPLQLLDGDYNKKITHFNEYWKARSGNLDSGGVVFNRIDEKDSDGNDYVNAIGNIVYAKNEADEGEESNWVAHVKDPGTLGMSSNYTNTIRTAQSDYTKKICNLNVDDEKRTSNTEISIKDILNRNYSGNSIISDETKFYFINEDKTIENDDNGKIFDGIYIINGDLNIKENVECTFDGDLIVLGNVNIAKGAKVKFKYDKTKTRDIQNKNLKNLIKIFTLYGQDKQIENESEAVESNSTRFIKNNIWKIIR